MRTNLGASALPADFSGEATASKSHALAAIFSGGIAAGTLDTLLAMTLWHINPLRVYRSVAAGLLGRDAYHGGLPAAAMGMFLHFFIATSAATVFWFASRHLPGVGKWMRTQWFLAGLAFGVAIYYFMGYVVLPLSRVPQGGGSEPTWRIIASIAGHAFLIGLPISYFAHRSRTN